MFENGEIVEVSTDNKIWLERIFVGLNPQYGKSINSKSVVNVGRFICVNKTGNVIDWNYCRKLTEAPILVKEKDASK